MKITVAPSDGIDKYEKEMSIIYNALREVTGEDFSDAMVTDESYITDFLPWNERGKERENLEKILGLSLNNPSLIYLCHMIRIKTGT